MAIVNRSTLTLFVASSMMAALASNNNNRSMMKQRVTATTTTDNRAETEEANGEENNNITAHHERRRDDPITDTRRRSLINNNEMEYVTISDEELLNTLLSSPTDHDDGSSITSSTSTTATSSTLQQLPIEIKSITTSSHNCYTSYKHGHSLGTLLQTSSSQQFEGYLIEDNGMILSTGNPTHFTSSSSTGNTTTTTAEESDIQSTSWFTSGDLELQSTYYGMATYDACYVTFEFRCLDEEGPTITPSPPAANDDEGGDLTTQAGKAKVSISYNFASEEYYEPSGSSYSDVFGIYLNGANIATVPSSTSSTPSSYSGGTNGDTTYVGVSTINENVNSQYYIGNDITTHEGIQFEKIQADGLTVQLVASGDVLTSVVSPNPGDTTATGDDSVDGSSWNTLKIVIADVGDRMLDSWLILGGNSLKCERLDGEKESLVSNVNVRFFVRMFEALIVGLWAGPID